MLREGEIFAGYVIQRALGHGGTGAVYLARHPRLPRWVALKLLKRELFSDSDSAARFEREADVVAGLDHPGIVTVFDRGVEGDQRWISMPYIDGVDASSLGPAVLSAEQAIWVIGQVAEALDYAHGVGVLHRDVKPGNILLAQANGQIERVLLADFGIARLRDDTRNLTHTGEINATLAFASPEQITAAAVDSRADQYSLACTLYWLLSGQAPFGSGNPAAVIKGHLQDRPPAVRGLRPDLPPALDTVLAQALAKRPQERFASCSELAAAAWQSLATSGAAQIHADDVAPRASVAAVLPAAQPRSAMPGPVWQGLDRPAGTSSPNTGAVHRRALIGIGFLLTIVIGVGAGVAAGMFTESSHSKATSSRVTMSAQAPDPADQKIYDEWRGSLDAMSAAFPGMVQPAGSGGKHGYLNAECLPAAGFHAGHSSPQRIAMKDWLADWDCAGGDGEAAFNIYSYRSPAAVQAVVDALPANEKSMDLKDGKTYTNYRYFTTDNGFDYANLMTTFPGDPQRRNFILLVGPKMSGRDKMDKIVSWWQAAPIG
ncbi:serine/threonine protein kinase [Nocardia elegans]|uniref:serine/threonine protein kinase n=1 Tax=Nocardia elegans TaxID=300029 RepID=UPI0007C63475|nr:serine/threonine-protein kinase [Nocardia elegans]MBF6447045.1 serine/threonine protein kinase [Nocardia elegans]